MSLHGALQNQIDELRREIAALRLLVEGKATQGKSAMQITDDKKVEPVKKAAPAKKAEPQKPAENTSGKATSDDIDF